VTRCEKGGAASPAAPPQLKRNITNMVRRSKSRRKGPQFVLWQRWGDRPWVPLREGSRHALTLYAYLLERDPNYDPDSIHFTILPLGMTPSLPEEDEDESESAGGDDYEP
jgi:hypothetical protein